MATQISNLFVTEYQKDVHHVFQREGGFMKSTVRTKMNVVGSSTTFNVAGKGSAQTKARHGKVPPMNATRSQVSCTLSDFYAGDWYDTLDEAKQDTDERMTIAKQGAFGLGRKCDELIISGLDGTSNSGTSWDESDIAGIESSALTLMEALWTNDVPNDGQVFVAVTPRCWSQLSKVESFASADYVGVDGQVFKTGPAMLGKFKDWLGGKWYQNNALTEDFTGTTASTRKIYAYHKSAVGFGMAKHAKNVAANPRVAATITYEGPEAAWFINHMMTAGACLIDDAGVIENTFDDSAAIVTS